MKKIIIILIILCALTKIHSSILLDFPHYNSRLYGSGESMLVERNDFNNIDIFPASIAGINEQELSMGYIKWLDLLNIIRAGYAYNLKDIGVIGGTINLGTLKETENYDRYGNLLGNVKNSDVLLNIGYGKKIKNNIHTGMNVKYLNMNVCGYKASWIGAGFSGLISLGIPGINVEAVENFNLGIGIQDINLLKAKFDKDSSGYPMKLNAGIVYKFLKIMGIETKVGTTYTYMTKYNRHYVSTGLEFGYKELLYLRSGYYISGRYTDKIAIGVGIGKDNLLKTTFLGQTGIKFDYSLSFLEEGIGHFIQLNFIFSPAQKHEKKDIKYYKDIKIVTEKNNEVLFNIKKENIELFKKDKSALSKEGKKVFNQIVKLIKKEDYKRVVTTIYTTGIKKQDLKLSQKRAKTIGKYLTDKNINRKRISYRVYDKHSRKDKAFKNDYKYEILLIRWKKGEEEKFKEHYFNGMDAYIKEGYRKAIIELGKALKIDPRNQDLKKRIKEAEARRKKKGIIHDDKKISISIEKTEKKLKKRKMDKITVLFFNYKNTGDSKKWGFLNRTIPDSVSNNLDDNNFINVIRISVLEDFISESGIKEDEMYKDENLQVIRKRLNGDIIIKGSFEDDNRKLQIETEILNLETGDTLAVIKASGEIGVYMFDLMDKTAEAIIEVFMEYRE